MARQELGNGLVCTLMKRGAVFYKAMRARDPRFDGKFFVGVKTTGIYCRPICPAKPKRENVEFFQSYLDAEKAGYRPCLRCRPESAPSSPAWVGKSAIVSRAVKVLHAQNTIKLDEDTFAGFFGVSARHLRRLFIDEIGKTPKQLAFENRLNLATKLASETDLPLSQVAFAAGFKSVRRFNDAFKNRFKQAPQKMRHSPVGRDRGITITLPYRPPFDFKSLLAFYKAHKIANLEWFSAEEMHRVVEIGQEVGQITISNDPKKSRLLVSINFPDTRQICAIIEKVRGLFDLESDPMTIASALRVEPRLRKILARYPGVRMPTGWDAFEVSVSIILGQQQTQNLVDLLGVDSGITANGKHVKLFPKPEAIISSRLKDFKTTNAKKDALIYFSHAVFKKQLSLEPTQNIELFIEKVSLIKGVGLKTAHLIAMRALKYTDAVIETDLVYPNILEKLSPWRAYATSLSWQLNAEKFKRRNYV